MAPELRKRKALSEAQKSHGAPSKIAEKSTKAKRKAADDASPVIAKKQKPAKKTTEEKKPVAEDKPKKPAKKVEAKKKKKEVEAEAASKVEAKNKEVKAEAASKVEAKKKELKAEAASKVEAKKKELKAEAASKVEAKKKEVEAEAARAGAESDSDEQEDAGTLLLADELDSGDEEVADKGPLFKAGQDVGKVPAISKEVLEAAKRSTGERGVIYIGRIPHGFYEHEMRQYLTQFGPVSRLRLSRNKKTGASKHFAFVEFEEESTAEIVAKTMDNYLLFGHILKVKMVPKGQVHEELFKGANKRFKKVPWNKMAGLQLAKPRTESAWEAKVERQRADRAKQAAKLKAMGYDFEVPELKDVPAPRSKGKEEVKAIEAAPMEDETGAGADEPEAEKPEGDEPEPEAKMTPAPKAKAPKARAPKGKASKSGKTKKAKA